MKERVMSTGFVESILIIPTPGLPTQSVLTVPTVPGMCLEGDRFFGRSGEDHKRNMGRRDITLIELCEPCQYLTDLTEPLFLPALVHRGGLRAEILTEGFIHIGNQIVKQDPP
jgi:hypothetical protein